MMKRLVKFLFFAGLLGMLAVLVVPGFINWNEHKAQVQARIAPYFQRQVTIGGNISIRVLPQPALMVQDVTVANAPGGSVAPFMKLAELDVRVKFAPLLEGRIEVESINLVNPELNLEVLPGGVPNWRDVMQDRPGSRLGGAAGAVKLNQLSVTNGAITYSNTVKGSHLRVDNLNLTLAAETLFGPYGAQGTMLFRDVPVKIDLATERYTEDAPMPFRVGLTPEKGMAEVKFSGIADLQSGIDLQGELSIGRGNLAGLFGIDALRAFRFLQDSIDLRGVLEFKGGQFTLSDMKAKFGQKGTASGKVALQLARNGNPYLTVDIEAANLLATDKGGDVYPSPPANLVGSIHVRGRSVGWGGRRLPYVDLTMEFDPKEWRVKSSRVDLPGGTVLKAAGVVSPMADSGNYTIQLATDDLQKLAASLAPADKSIFKALADTSVVSKLTLSATLAISPARLVLTGIEAAANDNRKITGSFSIDRLMQAPNFSAKLNFEGWDTSSIPPDVWDAFLQKIMASTADLDIAATNFARNGLQAPELTLRGRIGEEGINAAYSVKLAEAGTGLPPPLAWRNVELTGEVRGGRDNYSFTASGTVGGGDVTLSGTSASGVYQADFRLKHQDGAAGLALLDFPVERLLGAGALDLSGKLRGTGGDYQIGQMSLKTGGDEAFGSLQRKAGRVIADLAARRIDLDKWLAGAWNARQNMVLAAHAEDAVWQGQRISNFSATLQASPSAMRAADLAGTAWGGALKADLAMTRQNGVWSSTFKGALKQASLNTALERFGFSNLTAGAGDIAFNLSSADNTASSAMGEVTVDTGSIRAERFSLSTLGDMIGKLTAVPPLLSQVISDNLRHSGTAVFGGTHVVFKVAQGRAEMSTIRLSDATADIDIGGSANLKSPGYNLVGTVRLHQPGFPAFKIQSNASAPDYVIDAAPVEQFIRKNNPAPVTVAPDVEPLSAPPAAQPPVTVAAPPPVPQNQGGDIGDVLKRLEEDDGDEAPPPAKSAVLKQPGAVEEQELEALSPSN